jgi:hypothetical protein
MNNIGSSIDVVALKNDVPTLILENEKGAPKSRIHE